MSAIYKSLKMFPSHNLFVQGMRPLIPRIIIYQLRMALNTCYKNELYCEIKTKINLFCSKHQKQLKQCETKNKSPCSLSLCEIIFKINLMISKRHKRNYNIHRHGMQVLPHLFYLKKTIFLFFIRKCNLDTINCLEMLSRKVNVQGL